MFEALLKPRGYYYAIYITNDKRKKFHQEMIFKTNLYCEKKTKRQMLQD